MSDNISIISMNVMNVQGLGDKCKRKDMINFFLFVCCKIPTLFQVKKNILDLYGDMIVSLSATIVSLEVWPHL